MPPTKIPKIDFKKYVTNKDWDHGNDILYEIVANTPTHTSRSTVFTKVLFIGRIYAAAVERRKKHTKLPTVKFYTEKVWPTFRDMKLDESIAQAKKLSIDREEDLDEILLLHGKLVKGLSKITNVDKRSFASKYLHFHLPNHYFLYDTRAIKAVKKIPVEMPAKAAKKKYKKGIDRAYADYFYKCLAIRKLASKTENGYPIPRVVDNYLLYSSGQN